MCYAFAGNERGKRKAERKGGRKDWDVIETEGEGTVRKERRIRCDWPWLAHHRGNLIDAEGGVEAQPPVVRPRPSPRKRPSHSSPGGKRGRGPRVRKPDGGKKRRNTSCPVDFKAPPIRTNSGLENSDFRDLHFPSRYVLPSRSGSGSLTRKLIP